MQKMFVGAALLLGLAGCSVEAEVDSKSTAPKKVSPYQVIQHDDDSSAGYHVVEVKGGGKVYLMIRHDGLNRESMIKLDERYESNEYSDRVHGY